MEGVQKWLIEQITSGFLFEFFRRNQASTSLFDFLIRKILSEIFYYES